MTTAHRGYRQLSEQEVDLLNAIEAKGLELAQLVDDLAAYHASSEERGVIDGEARRWLAVGKTHLQQGLMALTRSVAKPGFF